MDGIPLPDDFSPEACRARIEQLRAFLVGLRQSSPHVGDSFDMGTWHHHNGCGTVGCIGGWAEALFAPQERTGDGLGEFGMERIGGLLGLNAEEAGHLFLMYGAKRHLGEVGLDDAIRQLEYIQAGNRPDWDATLRAAS